MKTSCPTKKNFVKTLAIVFLLCGGLLALRHTTVIQAQTAVSDNQTTLTAIPPRVGDDGSLKADPGETLQASIRVRNASSAELDILSQAQDFVIDKDGSTPIPIKESTPTRWSLASWITLAPAIQTLKPNEVGAVSVVIEVPKDALPGGHYAMITHQPNTGKVTGANGSEEIAGSVSGISQRVGTLLYVFVNGPVNEEAYLRNFNIPNFSEYGPVPFSFNVENLSDSHIQPSLKLEITDIIGRKVADLPLTSKNIFPLTEREFDGRWEQVWGYGHYTATLSMSYGNSGKIAIAKAGFWLFPATLAIAIALLALVLVAAAIIIRNHFRYRNNDQTKHIQELETKLKDLEGKA